MQGKETEKHKHGLNNYDITMLNKVKSWFSNTVYANTAITYNTVYNLMEDPLTTENERKLRVPLINIYRPRGFDLVPMQTFAARKQGYTTLIEGQGVGARYLTINLMYQFDLYAKSVEDLNIMSETLIKTFNFYPTIDIYHIDNKTNKEFKETYEVEYLSGPTEQSEFDNNDRVYRSYIQYEVKNAKLYDFTDYGTIKEIVGQLDTVDKEDNVETIEEIQIRGEGEE